MVGVGVGWGTEQRRLAGRRYRKYGNGRLGGGYGEGRLGGGRYNDGGFGGGFFSDKVMVY